MTEVIKYTNCVKHYTYWGPRTLYEYFNEHVQKMDFCGNESDYYLYIKIIKNALIYIWFFVDDLLICCVSKEKIHEFKTKLTKHFEMRDTSKIKSYVGIEIEYDYECTVMQSYKV